MTINPQQSPAIDFDSSAQTLVDTEARVEPQADQDWWRGAVIYQVYPRSLMDTSGDGIGDLPGICSKLDYIKSLGVDAIWVSPFFKSPMKDFGYDVSDFRAVDPQFGNLDDFDRLIDRAHQLGLRVMIDQVLSHTSDQHAWFQQSRRGASTEKADWYVWADANADGSVPNNWLSIFGGSAWQWEPERQQYYLHNFLASQPDLNFHCEAVRNQLLDEVEFWLKRGVDGLRLDAINYCYHDQQLRDNPQKPLAERKGRGFAPDNPYAAQYHIFDNTRPENLDFLKSLRALLDRYPGVVSLGEINSENTVETMASYTRGHERLHMGYCFELLSEECSAEYIQQTATSIDSQMSGGWPCWAVSNHDVQRVVSRWGNDTDSAQRAKLLLAFTATLRGTVCTYQGEELGLTEAPIEQHQLQDPYGKRFWPGFKGRDGCRTPMPWTTTKNTAGFSETKPWLPIPDEHLGMSVEVQESSPDSVLNFYRLFLRWRRQQRCLVTGSLTFLQAPNGVLAISRQSDTQSILGVFNLNSTEQRWVPPFGYRVIHPESALCHAQQDDAGIQLPANGFCFLSLNTDPLDGGI